MTESKIVEPREVERLLTAGTPYIDVRSEPEFEAGHVPGAVNVPLYHAGPKGLEENPEFVAVMCALLEPHAAVVVACKTGARSARAAQLLVDAGFTSVLDMKAGWDGARDAFGRLLPGWSRLGLPVETGCPQGQGYGDVRQRLRREP